MNDINDITPIQMVSDTAHIKELMLGYHKELVAPPITSKRFEGLLKEIVTPAFVGLYGDKTQGLAVRSIQQYVEDLIPQIETPKTTKIVDKLGAPILDAKGKQCIQYEKDEATGKLKMVKVPAFELSLGAYTKMRDIINQTFEIQRVYWKAREFVESHLSNIDELMFDKMNDYLWRNIMAVKYPDDVKREFKHLCINIKRKLYYLGDRDEVHNQTIFGLYEDKGGTGKTTLLKAFAKSFSNGNPFEMSSIQEFFKFNGDTKSNYGVMFLDEEAKGTAMDIKNKLKQFVDSDNRRVELKGVDAFTVRNLLTMVVAANHKIAPSLFEDEARGQRRDACFECIGLLQQYEEKDMRKWFDKMFDVCPFDDDYRTYRHHNPHHDELIDREAAVLKKILTISSITSPSPMGVHEFADHLEIKSGSDEWYGLKSILKVSNLFSVKMGRGTTLYTPNVEAISKYLGYQATSVKWWSLEFRNSRPWIDVDATIAMLESDPTYDISKPINYVEG